MQSTQTSFENLRKDFPILTRTVRDNKRLVYLDNASTTQKPNERRRIKKPRYIWN